MNPYSLSMFSFAVWTIFIAAFMAWRRKDAIGTKWLVFSVFASVWAIGWGQMLNNDADSVSALWWIRVGTAVGLIVPVLWLDFCYAFLRLPRPQKMLSILYTLSLTAALFSFDRLFIPNLSPYLQFRHHAVPGKLYLIKDVSFFGFVAYGFYLMFRQMRRVHGAERQRLLFFMGATAAGFLGCSITHFSIYRIGVPYQLLFLLPAFPLLMVASLMNHRLLDINELSYLAHETKLAMLGTLSTSILHELKNPLYLLENITAEPERSLEPARINEMLNRVKAQTRRALDTVERFKSFARPSEIANARETHIQVDALIQNALDLMEPVIKSRHIEVKCTIESNAYLTSANPSRLEHIILNLLQNASDASGDAATIYISAENKKESVTISVRDEGKGIPTSDMKKIFEPFYTTKAGQGGTGLGLFITKQLVEAEGGRITVCSSEGKGSTFSIMLPIRTLHEQEK